jgi:hypothetical protein
MTRCRSRSEPRRERAQEYKLCRGVGYSATIRIVPRCALNQFVFAILLKAQTY